MIIASDDRSILSKYDFSNTTILHLLRKEKLSFHQVCTFPYNILVLVTESSGENLSSMEGKDQKFHFTLKKDHFYFIPAGHTVEYDLNKDIFYYTFHVGFEVYPGLDLYSVQEKCIEGDGFSLIREMDEIWKEEDSLRKGCLIRKFLLQFFLAHWPEHEYFSRNIPEEFRELPAFLLEQGNAEWTVEKTARKMGLSTDTFTRKFHKYFGITPKKYLSNLLLRKVSALLSREDMTLRKAAGILGMSSEFYLSRFIRKNTGISAGNYRKQLLLFPGSYPQKIK